MANGLKKARMKRSELQSKYLKIQTQELVKSPTKSCEIFSVDCLKKNRKSTII